MTTAASRRARAEERKLWRRRRPRAVSLAALRMSDLNRLFQARYGNYLPDDDCGRDDALIAAHHLGAMQRGPERIAAWLSARCPWMTAGEVSALVAGVEAKRLRWKADTLAARLNLTAAERRALKITTIGAIDETREERAAARAARARLAKLEKRRAGGAIPREEYEASALSRLQPWQKLGSADAHGSVTERLMLI